MPQIVGFVVVASGDDYCCCRHRLPLVVSHSSPRLGELEVIARRHQLGVLKWQRPGPARLLSTGTATVLSNANTPVVNTIELHDTGAILKVLPHVNAGGTIQLEVDQEISNVVNSTNSNASTDRASLESGVKQEGRLPMGIWDFLLETYLSPETSSKIPRPSAFCLFLVCVLVWHATLVSPFCTLIVLQKSDTYGVLTPVSWKRRTHGLEVDMARSQFACGVSLTAIAVMMLGAAAEAQNIANTQQNMVPSNQGSGGRNHGGGGTGTTTSAISAAAVDPGPRGGAAGAGGPLPGLSTDQLAFFTAATARFEAVETVLTGLGPGFNDIVCSNCHAFPAVGGSSPATNPQVADAALMGAQNVIPSFITSTGPIREARFVLNADGTPDGGVHDLFVITGRSDAGSCNATQPDFAAELAQNNVIFRIPPPTFGDGLVEGVSDVSLQAVFAAQATQNASLGISGSFNLSGNTGNITRFGWKAQNQSLMIFAGEAYNVEEGVTNDVFPNKRNSPTPQCLFNPLPEDTAALTDPTPSGSMSSDFNPDTINFAVFMRLLAPPTPSVPLSTSATTSASASATPASTSTSTSTTTTPASTTVASASILPMAAGSSTASTTSSSTTSAASTVSVAAGQAAFTNVGCAGCHVQNQTTGNEALLGITQVAAVTNFTFQPFSDFAVHSMGTGLADGVSQGNANGFQFRSAPLWGIGQRLFFLHDGRTNNLLTAIEAHSSSGSEASGVITQFNMLSVTDQQNILNFLRTL
jgi:CxxC motif-containing protein (DUF1111 family)